MSNNRNEIAVRVYDMPMDDFLAAFEEKGRPKKSLLTESEQKQLAAWNATQMSYPQDVCIPQLVAAQAAAMPETVALVAGDLALSYRELNQRANQLANYLQALGVRSNVLVGLCVERSLDMVVGLLGILKAGGAYVPLDPSYPTERLSFMLEDAHTPILVTRQNLVVRLSTPGIQTVCFDADAAVLAQQSVGDLIPTAQNTDLAYVIYTSGSTGRPKGVQITHNSLLNLVFWHQSAFGVTSSDRATQLASPAFDAAGWELWPYLSIGASVYLLDEDTRATPVLCRNWLLYHNITITFLPTVLAEEVIALEWPEKSSLRFLLTGADMLHHYPSFGLPFTLINNYGPTEATVVATYGYVPSAEHTGSTPPIGRPIANTQIYILNEYLRQVPIGEPGELCIGGAGLAMGYLNRPELTDEKFILHQFPDGSTARLYRSGDQARFLPDGQIAFMGRIDHQIKIRGYRIEPNEIISLLNEHPAVQTSVVVAHEDTAGDKRLVAYIVPVEGAYITASSLRETLATRLPDYMVPAEYVVLEALPVTSNGKVDRAALPAPDATNTLRDEVAAVPGTPTEERVAGIVITLMHLEQIGIDDNFFLLGGHSLLGTQIIAHVAETFGVDLPLRSLFDAPTVRLLSAEIERRIIANLEMMSEEEVQRLLA